MLSFAVTHMEGSRSFVVAANGEATYVTDTTRRATVSSAELDAMLGTLRDQIRSMLCFAGHVSALRARSTLSLTCSTR